MTHVGILGLRIRVCTSTEQGLHRVALAMSGRDMQRRGPSLQHTCEDRGDQPLAAPSYSARNHCHPKPTTFAGCGVGYREAT